MKRSHAIIIAFAIPLFVFGGMAQDPDVWTVLFIAVAWVSGVWGGFVNARLPRDEDAKLIGRLSAERIELREELNEMQAHFNSIASQRDYLWFKLLATGVDEQALRDELNALDGWENA
jgi:hypothetical protein